MVYFFGFLGGLALFLYGMQLMGEGLQRAAGEKLQKILEKLTGVLPVAVALGAVVTGILQSSSATTVMTVGFVNAADEFKAGIRRCNGCQYRHNHDGTAYCF